MKNKSLFISLGTIVALTVPVITTISCSSEDKTIYIRSIVGDKMPWELSPEDQAKLDPLLKEIQAKVDAVVNEKASSFTYEIVNCSGVRKTFTFTSGLTAADGTKFVADLKAFALA